MKAPSPRPWQSTLGSRRQWIWALLLLGAAQSALALDPSVPVNQYRSRTWTQRDGLPQNSAVAITQDAKGYLWVATFGGLARFNGRQFTTYPSAANPGLPTDRIIALHCDPEGALWVGTEHRGATVLRNGTFHPLPNPGALGSLHGMCITQGRPGQMFIGTNDGFF